MYLDTEKRSSKKKSILEYFPYKSIRDGQRDILLAIEKYWENFDCVVIVAPTAFGKTAVLNTIGKWSGNASIITPTNLLVEQMAREFETDPDAGWTSGVPVHKLMKREWYRCTRFANGKTNCAEASAKYKKKLGCNLECAYLRDNRRAHGRGVGIYNYYTYMAHKLFRPTLLMDECIGGDTFVIADSKTKSNSKISTIYKKWKRGEAVWVKSFNETTGVYEDKKVTRAWERQANDKRVVEFSTTNTGLIKATEDHLFLTPEGWVTLKECKARDLSIQTTGRNVTNAFTGDSLQILYGSLLGDGSMTKNPSSEARRIAIVNKQEEYCSFKQDIIGTGTRSLTKSGYKEGAFSHKLVTPSIDAADFSFEKILTNIDVRGIAVWFMDDGSAQWDGDTLYRITLHTNAFSLEENELLVKMIKRVLGLDFGIFTATKQDGRAFYYLAANAENSRSFREQVLPYIHQSMEHKLHGYGSGQWRAGTVNKWAKIQEYKETEQDYVYDIEVEGNHNFLIATTQTATNGLVAHNCHNSLKTIQDLSSAKIWQHDYHYPWDMWSYSDIARWLEHYESGSMEVKGGGELPPLLAGLREEVTTTSPRYVIKRDREMWNATNPPELRSVLKMLPIDVRDAMPFLWPSKVKKIVMLSATISKVDIEMLGLDRRRVLYLEADSPIPADRRPIIKDYVGSINRGNLEASTRLIADKIVSEYLPKYSGQKGFIHATYAQAKILRSILPNENGRFIFHDKTNVRSQFDQFVAAPKESGKVMVASGLYEGVDLADDLGRWQLICKVPYPSLGDPAIKHKAEQSPMWYVWQALKDTMQACGRICRNETDFGESFILDGNFDRLYSDGSKFDLIPNWFGQAIIS